MPYTGPTEKSDVGVTLPRVLAALRSTIPRGRNLTLAVYKANTREGKRLLGILQPHLEEKDVLVISPTETMALEGKVYDVLFVSSPDSVVDAQFRSPTIVVTACPETATRCEQLRLRTLLVES